MLNSIFLLKLWFLVCWKGYGSFLEFGENHKSSASLSSQKWPLTQVVESTLVSWFILPSPHNPTLYGVEHCLGKGLRGLDLIWTNFSRICIFCLNVPEHAEKTLLTSKKLQKCRTICYAIYWYPMAHKICWCKNSATIEKIEGIFLEVFTQRK